MIDLKLRLLMTLLGEPNGLSMALMLLKANLFQTSDTVRDGADAINECMKAGLLRQDWLHTHDLPVYFLTYDGRVWALNAEQQCAAV